jgi:heptosyltransferase-1
MLADAKKFVFIAPTAGWGVKQWPAERYGAVAAELGKAGYRTLVNAVSPEDEVGLRVVAGSGGNAMLTPCSVGQMIELVRRAEVVIAGDTGPLHLAAALERPVVALFGPTDPARTGPFGADESRARVLRHGSSLTDHSRRKETEDGLMQITVGEVVEAALELLRGEQDKVDV